MLQSFISKLVTNGTYRVRNVNAVNALAQKEFLCIYASCSIKIKLKEKKNAKIKK
jgi:hypothetical protein